MAGRIAPEAGEELALRKRALVQTRQPRLLGEMEGIAAAGAVPGGAQGFTEAVLAAEMVEEPRLAAVAEVVVDPQGAALPLT